MLILSFFVIRIRLETPSYAVLIFIYTAGLGVIVEVKRILFY